MSYSYYKLMVKEILLTTEVKNIKDVHGIVILLVLF